MLLVKYRCELQAIVSKDMSNNVERCVPQESGTCSVSSCFLSLWNDVQNVARLVRTNKTTTAAFHRRSD